MDELEPGMAEKLLDAVFTLDCSFCGQEVEIFEQYGKPYKKDGKDMVMKWKHIHHPFMATKCCLDGHNFSIEDWNNRPIEDALQAENDRLRDAMGDAAKRLEDVHPPSGIIEDVIGALNNLRKDLS